MSTEHPFYWGRRIPVDEIIKHPHEIITLPRTQDNSSIGEQFDFIRDNLNGEWAWRFVEGNPTFYFTEPHDAVMVMVRFG